MKVLIPKSARILLSFIMIKILPHITRRKRGSAAVFPSLIVSSFSARFCFDVAQNDVFYQLL